MCSDALHIHIGNKITGAEPIFAIASFALPVVDHVKDLGVIIDEKLKFHLHINHVVASALTRANLILKGELNLENKWTLNEQLHIIK